MAGPALGGFWSAMRRDRIAWLGALVTFLAITPVWAPGLSEGARQAYAERYSDIPLVAMAVVAFQSGRRRLSRRAEREFCDFWTAGLGCWLVVELFDALAPSAFRALPGIQLLRSAGFVGLYLFAAMALEVRPHQTSPRAFSLHALEVRGLVITCFGLYLYFALVPVMASTRVEESLVPRVALYLLLDGYLLLRLAVLVRASSQRPGWPLTYRLLFLAVACWAGSDGAETLHWAGLLPRFAEETVLNWLWLPPFIALFLVARLRHAAPAIEEARAAEDSAPAPLHVSRGPLLLQAALLPALHILLKNLGAIDAETLDWREACAFVTFLVLTILALVYQRSIESQHQQLVAARVHAAEAATRAKSQFLATMSHELRTPMNGVLGATDVLLQTGLTDHQRRLAEILRVSAQALLNIVNDILDFSRIEAGKLQVARLDFDPRRILEEAAELLEEQAQGKGLRLVCRVEGEVPGAVRGDPGRLRQILINLLANAVKFTDQGRIAARLARAGDGSDARHLRFEVTDTGIGIPLEARSRIFQAFSQADGTTTRRFGGTGLGLAISRQLAELIGGELDFESEPGVGTRFWLDVRFGEAMGPVNSEADPPLAEGEMATLAGPREPGTQPPFEGRRVLLVEDNQVNQEVARDMLASLGCEVELAADGEQALARLSRQAYDAVLMDCMMPRTDGYAATAALRRRELASGGGTRTPVIALTASATSGDRARCLASGMDDYLSKPFRQVDLRAALARWLPTGARPPIPSAPRTAPDLAGRGGPEVLTDPIDPGVLAELRRLGTADLPGRVIGLYLRDTPDLLATLEEAARLPDSLGLQRAVHQIKSSSANVGARRLSELCRELEQLARANQVGEALKRTSDIRAEYSRVERALRAL